MRAAQSAYGSVLPSRRRTPLADNSSVGFSTVDISIAAFGPYQRVVQ
jgi:hypothetical protein